MYFLGSLIADRSRVEVSTVDRRLAFIAKVGWVTGIVEFNLGISSSGSMESRTRISCILIIPTRIFRVVSVREPVG